MLGWMEHPKRTETDDPLELLSRVANSSGLIMREKRCEIGGEKIRFFFKFWRR